MNLQGQAPAAAPVDDFAQDVMDTLGVSDWNNDGELDSSADDTPPPAAPVAGSEAGAGVDAPSPAPVTPPVAEPVTPPAPVTPEPAPAAPQATTPPAAPTTPPVAQPAVVPPTEEQLRTQSLAAQVDALQQQLQQMRANPAVAQPQAGQQPQAESGGPPVRRYNLTLPQQIKDALISEDPEQSVAAIGNIVNDLGTIVHNTVMTEVRQSFAALLQAAGASEQIEKQTSTANAAQEAYYSKFETHRNPLYLPLLQAESQRMAAEFPHLTWNEDYINALGTRVNARVAELATQTGFAPVPAPAPVAAPPARPAPMMPSGNRGSTPGTAIEGGDLIEDTLGQMFEQ